MKASWLLVVATVVAAASSEEEKDDEIAIKGDVAYQKLGPVETVGPNVIVTVSLHFKGATDLLNQIKPGLKTLG